MKFKKGQEVIIKKNLGELNGNSEKRYYFGGNINYVPLGSKGKIYEVYAIQDKIGIETKSGVEWMVHPNEIDFTKEWKEAEEKRQKQLDSHLEDLISSNVTNEETTEHSFNPKFNEREEYVFWVRKEFPKLKEHAKEEKKYEALEERKKEVLEGAKKAYKHGKKTTVKCTLTEIKNIYFMLNEKKYTIYIYDYFYSNSKNFATRLEKYVSFLEFISLNFNNSESGRIEKHHGIKYTR